MECEVRARWEWRRSGPRDPAPVLEYRRHTAIPSNESSRSALPETGNVVLGLHGIQFELIHQGEILYHPGDCRGKLFNFSFAQLEMSQFGKLISNSFLSISGFCTQREMESQADMRFFCIFIE
jgi:hypothetical protein